MYLLSPNRDVVLNYYVNCVRDINMNVTFEMKSWTFSFDLYKNLDEYQYSILLHIYSYSYILHNIQTVRFKSRYESTIYGYHKKPYGYFPHSLMFEHKMIHYVLLFVDCGNLFQIELSMKSLSSIWSWGCIVWCHTFEPNTKIKHAPFIGLFTWHNFSRTESNRQV